jgi:hypothetical protein
MPRPLPARSTFPLTAVLVTVWMTTALAAAGAVAEPGPEEYAETTAAQTWLDELTAGRLAAAREQRLVLAGYRLGVERESELYLLSHFPQPVEVTIDVYGRGGERVPLSTATLEPRRPLRVGLGERVPFAAPALAAGSLVVRYSGDPDMVSGWLVERTGSGVFERGLVHAEAQGNQRALSFWDVGALPGARPVFYLFNSGDQTLRVAIAVGKGQGEGERRELALAPGATEVLAPHLAAGWLEVHHDGEPGALVVSGVLSGGGVEAALPVHPPRAVEEGRVFEGLALPLAREDGTPLEPRVTLLCPPGEPEGRSAVVSVLDFATGAHQGSRRVRLAPGQVASVVVRDLLPEELQAPGRDLRLRVTAPAGGILPWAVAVAADGPAVDLPLVPQADAHLNGQYVLPSLLEHGVTTRLLNVGPEPVRVVAHAAWPGGEYSLEPFWIGPGEGHRLDWNRLAASGSPDLLGRTLDGRFLLGYFQWLADQGQGAILARTEARPLGSPDAFGFNCLSCCPEIPVGELVPGQALFSVGETPLFETCVSFQTCSGKMGPFPFTGATLTTPAGFSWNGVRAGAARPAVGRGRFDASERGLDLTCRERPFPFGDEGDMKALRVLVLEADLPRDILRVRLEPRELPDLGTLRVMLKNPSNPAFTRVIANTVAPPGDMVFFFGNLDSYPDGHTYTQVAAEWVVGQEVATGMLPYRFTVLGSYRHTCYNTPIEGDSGLPEAVVGTTPATCQWTAHSFYEDFLRKVNLNGSGKDRNGIALQLEQFCTSPPATSPIFCSTTGQHTDCNRFRYPAGPIRTGCGNAPTQGTTVAFSTRAGTPLICGDRVYIADIGVRTAEDKGVLGEITQLDHYGGDGEAFCLTWTDPRRKTFRLGR